MYSLAQNGYTWDEVKKLLSQSRTVSYGFDILDKNDMTIGEAHSPDCKIFNNIDAAVQRSASLTIIEDREIDFTSDRVRPYMRLKTENGTLIYPLGVFIMASPSRKSLGGAINRNVECYDKTQILQDDRFDLNEDTLWSGLPEMNFPEGGPAVIQQARELLNAVTLSSPSISLNVILPFKSVQ